MCPHSNNEPCELNPVDTTADLVLNGLVLDPPGLCGVEALEGRSCWWQGLLPRLLISWLLYEDRRQL